MTDFYIPITLALMAASHWISKTTGEHIALSSSDKLLWAYMLKRYADFSKLGKPWFDNQDVMAAATNSSLSTVTRFIRNLKKHGQLIVTTRQLSGCAVSNSYVIASDLELYNESTAVAAANTAVAVEDVAVLDVALEAPVVPQEAASDNTATHAPVAFKLHLVELTGAPVAIKEVAPWQPPAVSGCDEPQWDTVVSSGMSG